MHQQAKDQGMLCALPCDAAMPAPYSRAPDDSCGNFVRATHGLMGMVQGAHPAEEADGWVVRLDGAAPGQRQGLRNHDAVQGVLLHHSHPAPDQRLQASWRTWGHAHTGVRSQEGAVQRQHFRQAPAPAFMPVMPFRACMTGIMSACPGKGSCACDNPLAMAREYHGGRTQQTPKTHTCVTAL